MARNLKQLRRQSGMSREEWDYFMQTGNPPQGMSFEDASNITQQRDALNKEGYDESVADYEATDVGDYTAETYDLNNYVPPEDQQNFEYVGPGNQAGATDIQDVGEYQGQIQDVGGYIPPEDQQNFTHTEYTADIEDVGGYTAGNAMTEQGNMYVAGMTDDIRRADYDTDEAFTEALVRRRHEKNHPNPYNNMEGSGFYLNAAKDFYVGKDVIDRVDPYGLYPNIRANQPDVNQSIYANPTLNVVTLDDGTTINVDPGNQPVLTEDQTLGVDDPYVAPEDQEEVQGGHTPYESNLEPPPIQNPMAQNPMDRNPMAYNPAASFGLLQPGRLNIPRALPTSDELN
jgi:hypothetical protein